MESVDVAIVGGGVAGAAAACAFAGSGLDVVVYERRRLEGDVNRGDALHLEAVELLRRWEALEPLERRGAFWVRRAQLTTPRDRPKLRLRLEEPYLMLEHAGIETAMLEAAEQRGIELRRHQVQSAQRDNGGWRLATREGELRCRLLVGADGHRSLVRRAAGIEVDGEPYGQATIVLHAPRPRWLPADSSWALMHNEGWLLILPTTPPGICRVIIQVDEHALPRWRDASPHELRRMLERRNPRLGDLEIERRHGSHIYKLAWQHARRYVARGMALVGDAAHVTHTNGGQGMALAIHDAGALARQATPVLKQSANGSGELTEALWEYAARRRPANAQAIARADRGARLQHNNRPAYAASWTMVSLLSLTPPLASKVFAKFGGE